jgi:hypothetical protein
MVILMANKITVRHVTSTSWILTVAAIISAASYFVTRPAPVYEDGKLVERATFAAHDNGFPMTYIHTICSGSNLTCHRYLDWWGYAMNTLFLAVAVALVWFGYKWVIKKRARSRGKK